MFTRRAIYMYAQRSHLDPMDPVNLALGAGLLGSKFEGSGSGFDQSITADPVHPTDLDLDPTKRSRPSSPGGGES